MNVLSSWVLAAMTAWAPPKTNSEVPRYEAIASDIGAVAADEGETPVFDGDEGRARTALLLASTAFDESGFRADVDDGRARGDEGESVCIMQVRVGTWRTREGWTAKDLITDRKKCVRAALHRMHESIAWCKGLKGGDQLGGYTHGQCVHPNGI